jgi:hypothetical protein
MGEIGGGVWYSSLSNHRAEANAMPNPVADLLYEGPIPPGTVRVSGGDLYLCEFPSDAILAAAANLDTVAKRFREFGEEGITPDDAAAVARAGADSRSPALVIVAGLWLFLHEPGQVGDGAPDLLNHLIQRDGGAWIACAVDETAGSWTFALYSANQAARGHSETVH